MQKRIYFDYYDVRAEAAVQFGEKYNDEEWESFWEELMEMQASCSQEGILVVNPEELEYAYFWEDRSAKFKEFYAELLELVQREAGCDRAGINFTF